MVHRTYFKRPKYRPGPGSQINNTSRFDSKFEKGIALDLEKMKRAGQIKGFDRQFKVIMRVHRADGILAFTVSHKVDFRIRHNDDSFELLEAKGFETPDYKFRKRLLEDLWLPLHPDYSYQIVKQRGRR